MIIRIVMTVKKISLNFYTMLLSPCSPCGLYLYFSAFSASPRSFSIISSRARQANAEGIKSFRAEDTEMSAWGCWVRDTVWPPRLYYLEVNPTRWDKKNIHVSMMISLIYTSSLLSPCSPCGLYLYFSAFSASPRSFSIISSRARQSNLINSELSF